MSTNSEEKLKVLPMESLIGSPLVEVAKTQEQLSASVAKYIKEMLSDENGRRVKKPIKVSLIAKPETSNLVTEELEEQE